MIFEIPGFNDLDIRHILLDFNGTLATGGKIDQKVREQLKDLARNVTIHVLTADTRGNAAKELEGLPVSLKTSDGGEVAAFKANVMRGLGAATCVAVGNGRNDLAMFQEAALTIAVAGPEGVHPPLLRHTHIMVPSMTDALELFLDPERLKAGLRG